ncbi:LysR family transcriptional regulator [Micrococcus luteus]|nr:LysR family transcriptional regulator [Micrococcus luteus]
MDVHQAKAFLAVAEELHFGRAAGRLQIAQPALSRTVKQLERSLGTDLFVRSTRRVELTAAGLALLEPARTLVQASQTAREAVQSALAGETGTVRLGFAGASTHGVVGQLARSVRRRRPGLTLEIHSSQFSHLGLERVLEGSLDVAIGRWDFIPHELASRVIAHEEAIVALPADHPHAQETGPIDVGLLRDEPWVTLPSGLGSALANRLTTLATSAGFAPRVVQQAPDSFTQMVLVAAGLGCAVTLDSVRDNSATPGVVYRPVAGDNPPLEVRMLWRSLDASPALRAVLDLAPAAEPAGVAPARTDAAD